MSDGLFGHAPESRALKSRVLVRAAKWIYVAAGVALLTLVLIETDFAAASAAALDVGAGLAVVVVLYFITFLIDSASWHLACEAVPLDVRWLYRFWKVRMVGEVFNTVVPAGGMGGEPLKAMLLKKHYAIGLKPAMASLVLAKTINMVGLVAFLGIGFVLILARPDLSAVYATLAGAGLASFVAGIVAFYAIQRYRVTGLVGTWLSRFPAVARRLDRVMPHIHDIDEQLKHFYTRRRKRCATALTLAFGNWVLGAVEVYAVFAFMGRPIDLWEAWIIEAAVQLVRTGTFFIPGALGAQEGAFFLVAGTVTGAPALGVATALVRRIREAIWLVWGAGLGWLYGFGAARGWKRGLPGDSPATHPRVRG